ncbi:MAG: penicillin-binding protein [Streptosporangiales bacterium]|nr:penicillin-binding protein [Streptosporangiales bacterium]
MRRTWRRHLATFVVATALSVGVLSACGGPDEKDTATSFLAAWQRGEGYDAGRLTTTNPATVARTLTTATRALDAREPRLRLGRVTKTGAHHASATFTATFRLGALGVGWTYQGRFMLRESDDRWRVVWAPTVVHPALGDGRRFHVTRQFPSRAPILDREGGRLVLNESVVVVGVVPEAMTDREESLRTLASTTGIDSKQALRRIEKAAPKQFLPLITLRQSDYLAVKEEIYDLPGVHFRSDKLPLAKSRGYARQLLGTVGAVSGDRLEELGAPYTPVDNVGASGLQGAFERRLAGVPEGRVVVVDERGITRKNLATFAGRDGTAVRTTLDTRVQDAAEAALDKVRKPAALVAVRPSTGEVLAVANRPVDDGFNRALAGRYPPGSTFKVVTTAALLDRTDLRPTTTVPCPPRIVAGGKSFRNFEGEAAGRPDFRKDFAISCNTAFIRLSRSLPHTGLGDEAARFGFGSEYALGVSAYSGQVPTSRDATEQAAASIGQGRVLASPLTMALVAAAVREGTWRPPSLVTQPRPAGTAKPVRLDTGDAATLRSLMRSVVTSGTARSIGGGRAVAGKTGTAEFGSADPPRTHAWFIGYRGDLAFAVLIEDGGVGGEDAVPVAKAFLRRA